MIRRFRTYLVVRKLRINKIVRLPLIHVNVTIL